MAKLSFLAKLKFQWPAALSWLVLCSLLLGMLPGAANGDTEESYYDVELGECAFKAFAGDSFRCDRAGIREAITRCVVVAENSPPPALRMIAPDVPFAHILVDASLSFTSNAGLPNISWSLPSAPEVAEAMTSDLMGNRIHHAYVLPSNAIGDMTTAFGIAQDLSELTAIDNDLDWLGLLPLYRDALAVYDGAVRAIPTQGTMAQLYFRRDLLAAEGLQPPRTWAEVVSYATKFNGTDLNDDGVADYGICMWRDTCGGMPIPLVAILASLAQSKGRHSGLFFEPESMRCVVDTVAWDATLRLARTLASLAAPISAEPPSYTRPCFSHPLFSEGRCAMALALAGQFKSDSWPNNTGSYVRGRIGTSTLPGSEVVLDWQQDTLVQCDPDLCPYATRESISCSSSSGSDKLLANSSTSQRRRLRAGRRDLLQSDQAAVVNISSGSSSSPPPAATGAAEAFIWVNRAPYATSGGQSIFISKLKTVPQRLAAYTVAVLMVRDADNWPLVAGPGTEFGPTRQEHLDAVSKWAEYGYHPQDLAGFLSAARESLASGNVAIDLRAAGFSVFNDLFNNAAMMVVNTSMPIDDVIAYTRQKFAERLNNSAEAALLRSSYKASINFRTPKPPPPPYVAPAPASGQSQRNVAIHALAASLAGATTLSVVLVCVVWQLRSTRRLRYRFGRITAPGAGLATTICITDIEGSTRLWETLPGDVMSQAIQLHNQCIRHCATANNGYESAWEGDSVILGFHCAEDAVAFSVCVQERLLWLPWPEQLLEVDECRPMWLAKAPEAAQPPRTAPQSAVRPPSTAEDRRVSWSSTAATQLEPRPTIGAEHGLVSASTHALVTKTAGSQATCVVLPNKYSRNLSGGAPGILFWHAGVHHLDEHLSQPLEVFKVSTPSLAPRWALLQEPGPADKARTVSQGVAAAPVGHVFMSAVAVSGGAAIAAWNIGLWRESTGLLWREAASLCTLHGGFLATTRAGVGAVPSQPNRTGASGGRSVEVLLTAAFPAAAAALRWAASLIAHGLLADWPAALLLHEMAEEQLWLAPMPNRREPRQPPHGMTHESGGAVLGAQSAVGVQHGSVLPPVAGSHQPSLPHLRASRTSSGGQEASAGAAQGFNGDQVTPRLRTRLGSSPALTLLNEVRPQATLRTKPGTDPGEESTLSTLTVDPASGAGAAVGFLPAPEGTWLPADALAKAKSVGPEPAAEAAPLPAEKSVPSTRLQVLLADCASQGRTAPKPPHCSPFAVDSSAEAQKTLQRPPPLAQAVNLGRGARPILANLPLLGSSTVPHIEFLTVSHVSSSRGPLLPMRVPVRDVVCLPGHDARLQQVLSLPSDCSTYGAFPTPSQPPGLESGGNGYNESTQSSIWNGFASIAAPTHDCFGPVVRRPGLAASHGEPGLLPLSDDTASGGVPCAMGALQQPGGASAGSAPGAASEEATPSAAPKSRVPFLLGTAVRPTAVQVPAGDLAGGAVQCNTDQVARLFAARHIQGGTGDGEGGNDVGDGQEEEEAGSPRSTLPTALLDRLIARGLRLRAGVEGGMAYVEVNCVSGDARYGGPAAAGAVALAERAPVSRVLVSPAVMTAVRGDSDGGCSGSALADLHPSVAARISIAARPC